MIDRILDFSADERPDPARTVRAMQADTCDGILHFPDWENGADERYYVCKMQWSPEDAERLIGEYEEFRKTLQEMAALYERGADCDEKRPGVAASPRYNAMWDTYLRPFATEQFDGDAVFAIQEKLEEWEELTPEESELYDRYCKAIFEDCAERLRSGTCAYRLIIHAKRVFQLMTLQAPKVVIDNECAMLAAAMALHTYCTEMTATEL